MHANEINISEQKIQREFEIIKMGKLNGYETQYSWNECILYFQWKEFYKKEIELWNENKFYKGLPLRSWIYANRLKYIKKGANDLTFREILRAFKITGLHIGNSFHSPFYIQQFIKDYNIKSIYDPTGGWGHRLLGAWNIPYIYNDINTQTYLNCLKMSGYFHLENKSFYNRDCATFTPEEDYEAVFTCPPYFGVEKYSFRGAENLSFDDFICWWESTIQQSCINKPTCKYFAFIINGNYKDILASCCIDLGLKLIQEIPLGLSRYSHLNSNKEKKKREFLLVFSKNKSA